MGVYTTFLYFIIHILLYINSHWIFPCIVLYSSDRKAKMDTIMEDIEDMNKNLSKAKKLI